MYCGELHCSQHRLQQFPVNSPWIQEGINVLLGDDDNMDLCSRPWVVESEHPLILPNYVHRQVSC
mgnify:CR=1 FL=1